MSNRDDFKARVKEKLAERVCRLCSNPNCRKPTSGPHSEPEKAISIGVAAHITAAAPGGSRYDLALTPEERQGIGNGIWLCQSCSRLIDMDEQRYTVTLLEGWKRQAESKILRLMEEQTERSVLLVQDTSFNLTLLLEFCRREASNYVARPPMYSGAADTPSINNSLISLNTANLHAEENKDEFLASSQKSLIVGEPGVGKSYLLYNLALDIAQAQQLNQEPIVVPLVLRAKAIKNGTTVFGLILKKVQRVWPSADMNTVVQGLNERRFALIIDGFDEVRDDKNGFLEELEDLLNFDPPYFYLSSRITNYHGELDHRLEKWRVDPLTHDQIFDYIHSTLDDTDIRHNLYGSSELFALLKYPLYLSVAVRLIKESNDVLLPNNRALLHERSAEALVREWNASRSSGQEQSDIGFNPQLHLLGLLAAASYGILPLSDAEQYVSTTPGAAITNEFGVLRHSGMLSGTLGDFEFLHQTFQEFFLARHLAQLSDSERYNWLRQNNQDEKFNEVILLLVGLMRERQQQEQLINYLLNENLTLFIKSLDRRQHIDLDAIRQRSVVHEPQDYLGQMVFTYRVLFEKYFRQVRHRFEPYAYLKEDIEPDSVHVIAQNAEIDFEQSLLRYKLGFVPRDLLYIGSIVERVRPPSKPTMTHAESGHTSDIASFKMGLDRYVNLDFHRLGVDSAREVALSDVTDLIRRVVGREELLEHFLLVAQRIIKRLDSIIFAFRSSGIDSDIASLKPTIEQGLLLNQEYLSLLKPIISQDNYFYEKFVASGYGERYIASLVEKANSVVKGIEFLDIEGLEISQALPPGPDKLLERPTTACGLYSNEAMQRRIEWICGNVPMVYQWMIDENFNDIAPSLLHYRNYPWRYNISFSAIKDSFEFVNGWTHYLEPREDENLTPIVRVVDDLSRDRRVGFSGSTSVDRRGRPLRWSGGTRLNQFPDNDILIKLVYGLLKDDLRTLLGGSWL